MSATIAGWRDVVYRNVEEALNLVCMQVDGYHAVVPVIMSATTLAVIGIVRGTRRSGGRSRAASRQYATGGGATQCVIDQQFHDVVGGVAGGLDDEDVLAAHVFLNFHGNFTIAEHANVGIADGQIQVVDHGAGSSVQRWAKTTARTLAPLFLTPYREFLARRRPGKKWLG